MGITFRSRKVIRIMGSGATVARSVGRTRTRMCPVRVRASPLVGRQVTEGDSEGSQLSRQFGHMHIALASCHRLL